LDIPVAGLKLVDLLAMMSKYISIQPRYFNAARKMNTGPSWHKANQIERVSSPKPILMRELITTFTEKRFHKRLRGSGLVVRRNRLEKVTKRGSATA
jgi:hypothetical protein